MPPKRVANRGEGRRDASALTKRRRNLRSNNEVDENAGNSPSKSVLEDLDSLSQDQTREESGGELSEDDSHAIEDSNNEILPLDGRDCSGNVQVDGVVPPSRDTHIHTSHNQNNMNAQPQGNRMSRNENSQQRFDCSGNAQVNTGMVPPSRDMLVWTSHNQSNGTNRQALGHWTGVQPGQNGGNNQSDDLFSTPQQQPPQIPNTHNGQMQTQQSSWQHGENELLGEFSQRQVVLQNGGRNESLYEAGRRAMSYRASKAMQQKHVATRIQNLVKTIIFRKCKFITSGEYFNKVMQVVVDVEKPADTSRFVRIYKACVVGSLNAKRSTCEQAARDAFMMLLKRKNHLDEVAPPPYSMETLCKLRQSRTADEKEAFLWFAGELLECVSGKRAWGARKKYKATISEAKSNETGESIVTISDEAFALLMYENYMDKWIERYHDEKRGEPGKKRIAGRYTKSSIGYCEYGGWSEDGVLRFNELCKMVQEDRASRNAREAEEQLLASLRRQAGQEAERSNEREIDYSDSQRSLERNPQVVNAFIEM